MMEGTAASTRRYARSARVTVVFVMPLANFIAVLVCSYQV